MVTRESVAIREKVGILSSPDVRSPMSLFEPIKIHLVCEEGKTNSLPIERSAETNNKNLFMTSEPILEITNVIQLVRGEMRTAIVEKNKPRLIVKPSIDVKLTYKDAAKLAHITEKFTGETVVILWGSNMLSCVRVVTSLPTGSFGIDMDTDKTEIVDALLARQAEYLDAWTSMNESESCNNPKNSVPEKSPENWDELTPEIPTQAEPGAR